MARNCTLEVLCFIEVGTKSYSLMIQQGKFPALCVLLGIYSRILELGFKI
jgi:hypothetical protein